MGSYFVYQKSITVCQLLQGVSASINTRVTNTQKNRAHEGLQQDRDPDGREIIFSIYFFSPFKRCRARLRGAESTRDPSSMHNVHEIANRRAG